MNLLFSLSQRPLAETVPAPVGGLETGTVLLGLLIMAVAWLAATMASLRNEVAALKDTLSARPPPALRVTPPVVEGPAPGEVAAIAAAVRYVLGAGVRVVAVVPPDASAQAWSREGRREVFQSHQLR